MKTNFLEMNLLNNQPILVNIASIAFITRNDFEYQDQETVHILMHNGKEFDVVEEYKPLRDLIELALRE